MLNSYKDLLVWQKAIELVKDVYKLTADFPREELYNLTSQIRKSAVSIPSNIAEGYDRNSTNDYISFLFIARGSIAELETQLIIVQHVYPEMQIQKIMDSLVEVQKMIKSLINSLKIKLGSS